MIGVIELTIDDIQMERDAYALMPKTNGPFAECLILEDIEDVIDDE